MNSKWQSHDSHPPSMPASPLWWEHVALLLKYPQRRCDEAGTTEIANRPFIMQPSCYLSRITLCFSSPGADVWKAHSLSTVHILGSPPSIMLWPLHECLFIHALTGKPLLILQNSSPKSFFFLHPPPPPRLPGRWLGIDTSLLLHAMQTSLGKEDDFILGFKIR